VNNIIIEGAKEGNLKNISLELPRNKLVVLTGLSGSGKSTLALDTLYQECQRQYLEAIGYQGIGTEVFDQIISMEQSPLTRMKRSNVATYSDVYTEIRKIFSELKDARDKGLTAKHFSFNTHGGRCENCEGHGYV